MDTKKMRTELMIGLVLLAAYLLLIILPKGLILIAGIIFLVIGVLPESLYGTVQKIKDQILAKKK